jgi:hypothetical protein
MLQLAQALCRYRSFPITAVQAYSSQDNLVLKHAVWLLFALGCDSSSIMHQLTSCILPEPPAAAPSAR